MQFPAHDLGLDHFASRPFNCRRDVDLVKNLMSCWVTSQCLTQWCWSYTLWWGYSGSHVVVGSTRGKE